MTDKIKKPRIPRNAESILQEALKLSLEEKVRLCRLPKDDIQKVADEATNIASKAKELINGL